MAGSDDHVISHACETGVQKKTLYEAFKSGGGGGSAQGEASLRTSFLFLHRLFHEVFKVNFNGFQAAEAADEEWLAAMFPPAALHRRLSQLRLAPVCLSACLVAITLLTHWSHIPRALLPVVVLVPIIRELLGSSTVGPALGSCAMFALAVDEAVRVDATIVVAKLLPVRLLLIWATLQALHTLMISIQGGWRTKGVASFTIALLVTLDRCVV